MTKEKQSSYIRFGKSFPKWPKILETVVDFLGGYLIEIEIISVINKLIIRLSFHPCFVSFDLLQNCQKKTPTHTHFSGVIESFQYHSPQSSELFLPFFSLMELFWGCFVPDR